MFQISLSFQQQTYDFMSPLEACQSKGRILIRLDLRINIGPHVEQESHRGSVSVHRGQHKR